MCMLSIHVTPRMQGSNLGPRTWIVSHSFAGKNCDNVQTVSHTAIDVLYSKDSSFQEEAARVLRFRHELKSLSENLLTRQALPLTKCMRMYEYAHLAHLEHYDRPSWYSCFKNSPGSEYNMFAWVKLTWMQKTTGAWAIWAEVDCCQKGADECKITKHLADQDWFPGCYISNLRQHHETSLHAPAMTFQSLTDLPAKSPDCGTWLIQLA